MFGMTAATLIGIFIVPVFYVVIQGTFDRLRSQRKLAAQATTAGLPRAPDGDPPP